MGDPVTQGATTSDAKRNRSDRKLRVIVIDDDEMVRHVVTRVVQRRNCDVLPLADASACCIYANTDRVCPCKNGVPCADALLTDVKMPGIDGLDFLDALDRCKCRIPHRGIMSAFWSTQSLNRARKHGCRIFVKPVGILDIDHWLADIERTVSDSPIPP